MIPRFGAPRRNEQSYVLRPGAYAVLPLGRRILLTHQSLPEPEYQLPGGGIDPGESPITALHREVIEETGWRIAIGRRIGVYRRFGYMPEYDMFAEKICHVFLARPVRQLCAPTEPHHTAAWLARGDAISALASEGDRAALMQLGA